MGETGVVAFTPATNDTIQLKGDEYKGSFLGVDIYVSSYVTNDGTNNDQAIWAPGALLDSQLEPLLLLEPPR